MGPALRTSISIRMGAEMDPPIVATSILVPAIKARVILT